MNFSISEQQQFKVDSCIGTTFLHVESGRRFIVMGHCMIEETMEVGVLYMHTESLSKTLWVRPYSYFFDEGAITHG